MAYKLPIIRMSISKPYFTDKLFILNQFTGFQYTCNIDVISALSFKYFIQYIHTITVYNISC